MTIEVMYVVQDSRSYVGNSVLWWAQGGRGYTCDIRMAQLYTFHKAQSMCVERLTDKMWKYPDVLKLVQHHIDVQDLCKDCKMNHPHTYSYIEGY